MHRRGRRWWCASAHHLQLSATCIVAVRGFLVDRYVVHRHVMCVVIRTHLCTRFFLVGGGGREARAGTLAPATKHAPAYMPLNFYFTLVPDTA